MCIYVYMYSYIRVYSYLQMNTYIQEVLFHIIWDHTTSMELFQAFKKLGCRGGKTVWVNINMFTSVQIFLNMLVEL